MRSTSITINNSYFDYAPVWSHSNSPLLVKVATAVGTLLLNLGFLFANACLGIGQLVNNLLSDSSNNSNNFFILQTPSHFPKPSAPPWDPNWGPYPG